jgi:hypothetical protein
MWTQIMQGAPEDSTVAGSEKDRSLKTAALTMAPLAAAVAYLGLWAAIIAAAIAGIRAILEMLGAL